MSLILDALKKSETERQQQGSAEFSNVPASSPSASPARWLWILAVLLLVNFAVLIGILMRSDDAPAVVTAPDTPADEVVQPAAGFAEQIAEAVASQPKPAPKERQEPPATSVASSPQVASATNGTTQASVPTIDQLRLAGTLQIAPLHLDIHVFSENPADRFVFINMVKHREDSRIAEGPVVREITTDGVILEYQGRAFLLPRE